MYILYVYIYVCVCIYMYVYYIYITGEVLAENLDWRRHFFLHNLKDVPISGQQKESNASSVKPSRTSPFWSSPSGPATGDSHG